MVDTRSEDRLLQPLDRDRLVSNARSLRRNAAIAAWAIRKSLDHVSSFEFQVNIREDKWPGARELSQRIEDLYSWWCRPLSCDVSGRYSLPRLIRMMEAMRTVDGDCFVYKMSDGRIQLIEGDRVRTPSDLGEYKGQVNVDDYIHGVQVSDSNSPMRYAICDRGGIGNQFILRDLAQARYVVPHGFYDRPDQVRGISPLSAAMNTFFDVYEAQEFALAKMKLAQLFALKYKHGNASEDDGAEAKAFEFGSGPQLLELDPEDDASFLESNSPSTEFQSFMQVGIQIGLKSLDIPYSFFDESHTNYSGARSALLEYELSANAKRNDLRQVLNNLWVWRMQLFIADGVLVLPEGMGLDDIAFEFIGTGIPWIDPMKEVAANAIAVKSGFKSRQQICKEDGQDFFKVADQIAQENAYLKEKGLGTDIENITLPLDQLLTQGAGLNAEDQATK